MADKIPMVTVKRGRPSLDQKRVMAAVNGLKPDVVPKNPAPAAPEVAEVQEEMIEEKPITELEDNLLYTYTMSDGEGNPVFVLQLPGLFWKRINKAVAQQGYTSIYEYLLEALRRRLW